MGKAALAARKKMLKQLAKTLEKRAVRAKDGKVLCWYAFLAWGDAKRLLTYLEDHA